MNIAGRDKDLIKRALDTISYAQDIVDDIAVAQGRPWLMGSYSQRQVEPGVVWKNEGDRRFVGFKDTPMMDWDWPDAIHPEASVTIKGFGDVAERLEDYLLKVPDDRLAVYMTPGGVRAWSLARRDTPVDFFSDNKVKNLDVDNLYARFATEVKHDTKRFLSPEGPYDFYYPQGAFFSRISPKPARISSGKEFIAYPIGMVGNGLSDPTSMSRVNRWHDQMIDRVFMTKPKTQQEKLVAGQLKQGRRYAPRLIRQQIAGIRSPALRREWERRFDGY